MRNESREILLASHVASRPDVRVIDLPVDKIKIECAQRLVTPSVGDEATGAEGPRRVFDRETILGSLALTSSACLTASPGEA